MTGKRPEGRELSGLRVILYRESFELHGGIYLAKLIEWDTEDLCMKILPEKRAISKYWTLVNDMHTDLFRG